MAINCQCVTDQSMILGKVQVIMLHLDYQAHNGAQEGGGGYTWSSLRAFHEVNLGYFELKFQICSCITEMLSEKYLSCLLT